MLITYKPSVKLNLRINERLQIADINVDFCPNYKQDLFKRGYIRIYSDIGNKKGE